MIELKNEILSIGVLPETGACLNYLKYKETDILRPSSENETDSNQSALFPMLPYASFIQDGHFPYYGITRNVEKNSSFSKYPMHGDIWRSKLHVKNKTENSITLSYQHDKAKGFPFSYSAEISYILKENTLEILLSIQNDSVLPMPYGMGIHPFFKKDMNTLIQFKAPKIWFRGDDPILGHPYTAPTSLDFQEPKIVPANGTNVSFGSWDSQAKIIYPNENITIDILADNSFRHLILYTPKGKDFFCLEPVSHTPDAFNLAAQGIVGTGIQTLGPNESATNTITFTMKGKQ